MNEKWHRREVLKQLAAGATLALCGEAFSQSPAGSSARELEVRIFTVSDHTFRLFIQPANSGASLGSTDGSLVRDDWGRPVAILHSEGPVQTVRAGNMALQVSPRPLSISVANAQGQIIQRLALDHGGGLSFTTGDSPLLGLGEGGPQFDRRGSADSMISGQGGYRLQTHGGRVPIPWLIGTAGWAIFIHKPLGTFDFTRPQSRFLPAPGAEWPLDIFFVASGDPATIMAEYARLTGHAEIPPLWSFGYQQSHRTLASPDEVLGEAKTFRDKKLPCDTLIYLGTGFCPSGWNTQNGSFAWNSRVFPDPQRMIEQLHQDNFRVVLHAVILADQLRGRAQERCDISRFDEEDAGCYWSAHRKDFAMGVDGWWPDEGDPMDAASRLTRIRMYWEGPQMDRPNERPFALHRNGYAGMQRYGAFLWSGDVYSTWETLKTQIPIAINTSLTGIPYWGTDIGGFVPTREFTAELYLRWFQFAAFCTLFRAHGRTWKLRLPWGWNTGDPGPVEIRNYDGAAVPDASQLHNAQVEPICRKYLELRYRMLPYLYSTVRECATTGMPVMRALWLHYPDDPRAVACGDQYMWGPNILVAPVVEPGATARQVYLPRGSWYDFWTAERVEGGREVTRAVDLETLPLYIRAGSILPLGPVKQHVADKTGEPLVVLIHAGSDASFLLYEDDGRSFNYRNGQWMGIQMDWQDARRALSLRLAPGSRMLSPSPIKIQFRLDEMARWAEFDGSPAQVRF